MKTFLQQGDKMSYKLTNNNTVFIPQIDYKGDDRDFNYLTGMKFIPFQTTMMIADASTLAGGALSGDGFLYVGCSDTIPMEDLEKVSAMSDLADLHKQLGKLSPRKKKKLLKKMEQSYSDTYNIAMNKFIEWCVDSDLSRSMIKYFMNTVPTVNDEGEALTREDWCYITECLFARETQYDKVQPNTFPVSTLNPIRNFEAMTDAKFLFFLCNIKGKIPHLLCVVHSEKENYYGLDDIPYYEFSYLPNAITAVLHPSQIDEMPMWLGHLNKRLKGAILAIDSNKKTPNGKDIQIVIEVLDYCNGYVHLVAHHHDENRGPAIRIKTDKGDITAPANQYRWWVPLDQLVAQGSDRRLMTVDFGSVPMDVAFLSGMKRDEMMRSCSILCALVPLAKNKTKSQQDLWVGDRKEMKAEVRK